MGISEHIIGSEKANQDIFSKTLELLAVSDKSIIVVTSDSRGSGKLVGFGQAFPEQHIEVGIAEQNLVGVAAGVASTGKKTFAVSPACFLTARALEQIKNDVAYSDNPVRLIGISAGVSYGALGSTHHSLHDFAALRAIHNITIVAPADAFETEMAVIAAVSLNKPLYLRFGKKALPLLPMIDPHFSFGKSRLIQEGNDIALIGTGETVIIAYQAAKLLLEKGIHAKVVSMHTIKPLDQALLIDLGKKDMPILTIEEHSIHGGLGEACASFLMQEGFRNRFSILGIPDEYTITGSQMEILGHYGISAQGIAAKALQILEK